MPIDYGSNDVSSNGNFVASSGNFTTALTLNGVPVATGVGVTITNAEDNRILTSNGTSTGINAENNLTFDGTTLGVTGVIDVGNLRLEGNTISSTNTNGNIIIENNGTGALQRDSGGNNRGIRAVDLQNQRLTSSQVAGGSYSSIGGGAYNMADGYASTVGGGSSNSAPAQNSTVAGGDNNSAGLTTSDIGCTVAGGVRNLCQGNYSAIGGGNDNETDTIGAVVGGGSNNYVNGDYSTVVGGFRGKATRYGEVTHAAGRFSNDGDAQHITLVARGLTLSGAFTVDISDLSPATFTRAGHSLKVGDSVTLSTTGTLPTGLNTTTTYYVLAEGLTSSSFRLSTTKNGAAVITSGSQSGTHSLISSASLTLNGATGTATQQKMVIPARSTWSFSVNLSAYSAQNNQGGAWWVVGGVRRNLSTTVELGNSTGLTFLENAFSSNLVSVDADTDNGALDIRVTGIANQSIRWVAVIDITQVSFGTP